MEVKLRWTGPQHDVMSNAGDIHTWLADQGFAKYGDAFANNAIGLGVLPELTDIGVLAYFGYLGAHGDDRVVRAGLAILNVVGTLKPAVDGQRQQFQRRAIDPVQIFDHH
jgi:hypothetical protein